MWINNKNLKDDLKYINHLTEKKHSIKVQCSIVFGISTTILTSYLTQIFDLFLHAPNSLQIF